jgi:hypothetical protein
MKRKELKEGTAKNVQNIALTPANRLEHHGVWMVLT